MMGTGKKLRSSRQERMPPRAWVPSVEMKRTGGGLWSWEEVSKFGNKVKGFTGVLPFQSDWNLLGNRNLLQTCSLFAHYKLLKGIFEVIDLSEVKLQIRRGSQDPCLLISASLAFPSLGAAGVPSREFNLLQ